MHYINSLVLELRQILTLSASACSQVFGRWDVFHGNNQLTFILWGTGVSTSLEDR